MNCCEMRLLAIFKTVCLVSVLSRYNLTSAAQVYVDAIYGSDENCSSLQDVLSNQSFQISDVPCQTINAALGYVNCGRNCSSDVPLLDSVVILSDGVHTLTNCIGIKSGRNMTIEGENLGKATVRCAERSRFGNIAPCLTDGLIFRGINFEGCGPSPNVFLNRSNNVVFEYCSFRGNTGPPLRAQFVPSIRLFRTQFLHNINQRNVRQTDNENTTISILFRSFTTAGGFTYFSRNESVEITIDECTFINNTAEFDETENDRPVLFKADGHGGAILVRLAQVIGAKIEITNSVFDSNFAGVDGAGIYFSLSENFSSSSITLYNNTFSNNVAFEATGGAISFNIFSISFNNSMLVENCRFFNNSGGAGGAVGVSLYDSSSASTDLQDRVSFVDCEFVENKAKDEGTAVGLFSLVGVEEFGFPIDFVNCSLIRNSYFSHMDQTPEHASALLAFRFPVNFRGYNIFSGNQGGGISLQNTRIIVQGNLLLHNNSAMRGGGISMEDTCVIQIEPEVNITLVNNSAILTGGGIYVSFPAIRYTTTIFNRLCFLQYTSPNAIDVPPYQWDNVSISFLGNHADFSGAAIYASDMRLCRWIGNEYASTGNETRNIFDEPPPDIAHLTPFTYRDNTVSTNQSNDDLATAPNQVFVTLQVNSSIVQSGEYVLLDVLARDEVGNSREAIIALDSPNENTILRGISTENENITYRVPAANFLLNVTECTNIMMDTFSLDFSLPGTLSATTTISLRLNGCHPGYRLNTDSCTCMCDLDQRHLIRCDSFGRYLLLQNGVWGGTVISDGVRQLITGYPPVGYLTCSDGSQGRLPGCRFKWDNVDAQCVTGRQGTFCGRCVEGYGVTLDLQQCVEDTNNLCTWGLVLFITLCFLVVLSSFLILFFNFGLPNELKGFLFYVQVVGLVFRPYQNLQTVPDSTFVSSLSLIVNLMGFSLPIPLCISTSVQAQHVALLGYISPILALITVLVYALSARCLKVLSNRSALSGITLLSLFIYKYVADTSFTLVSCSPLNNDWVFTYNGSVSCSRIDLLFVIIFALVVVILFVGPAPFVVSYICVKRPQKFQHYADVLTAGIRAKHHWFGGYDIARRLPFIFFSFTSTQPSSVLLLMITAAVTILIVHMLVQPYEKQYINVIETLILMNLVAVGVVSLNPSVFQFPQWLLAFLILAPFIYGLLYVACTVGFYIHKRLSKTEEKIKDTFIVGNALSAGKILALSGVKLWRKRTCSVGLDTDQTSHSIFHRRRTCTVSSDSTELDEFVGFRESLLDS